MHRSGRQFFRCPVRPERIVHAAAPTNEGVTLVVEREVFSGDPPSPKALGVRGCIGNDVCSAAEVDLAIRVRVNGTHRVPRDAAC